jgi:hypothetical protein
MLLRVGKSVDLLSNRVLASFLLRIDGEINGEAWELKVLQWRKRERALVKGPKWLEGGE